MHSRAPKESPSPARKLLLVGLPLVVVAGAAALALAVPKAFDAGTVLRADDLNMNFKALDTKLAELEKREPFAGTYPAVLGLGRGTACGMAPNTINVASPDSPSDAFGSLVFTDAGRISVAVGDAYAPNCQPQALVCGRPLTFFLQSTQARTISVRCYLDNAGAVYVNGQKVWPNAQNVDDIPVPSGSFALTFMACSNDGPTIGLAVSDRFLDSKSGIAGISVDYDRVFHRNGK